MQLQLQFSTYHVANRGSHGGSSKLGDLVSAPSLRSEISDPSSMSILKLDNMFIFAVRVSHLIQYNLSHFFLDIMHLFYVPKATA